MRDYQQAAVELGFLHHRYPARHPAARLRRARPELRRPGSPPSAPTSPSPDRWYPPDDRAPVPTESADSTEMLTALVQLRDALQEVRLPLELPGAPRPSGRPAGEMVDQLEDYVIPRLMTIDAPLLTVVGGSTGAGKSTLVNSLVGTGSPSPACSARPPARRCSCTTPTTRSGSARTGCCPTSSASTRATNDPAALQLVPSETVPAGLAILDAPDIDSVEERNRTLAAQLLAAADLWLFVTSAARYADQVPWELPAQAAERSRRGGDRARPHPARGRRDRRRPTSPGCWPAAGSRTRRCSPSPRAASTTTACCPPSRSPRSAAGSSRWPPTPTRAPPWSGRPSTARSAPSPGVPTRSPTPRPSRSTPTPAARGRRPGLRRGGGRGRRGLRRRHPAARRGAGPLAGVRRHRRAAASRWRPRSAGCATGSSTRSRASRSRPSGSPSPSSPASRR